MNSPDLILKKNIEICMFNKLHKIGEKMLRTRHLNAQHCGVSMHMSIV